MFLVYICLLLLMELTKEEKALEEEAKAVAKKEELENDSSED